MTALPQDALRIARWAWPEKRWSLSEYGTAVVEADAPLGMVIDCFEVDEPGSIHAAEQVAVERGHGPDLVGALAYTLGLTGKYWQQKYRANREGWELSPAALVQIAFAPLEARALALHRLVVEMEET